MNIPSLSPDLRIYSTDWLSVTNNINVTLRAIDNICDHMLSTLGLVNDNISRLNNSILLLAHTTPKVLQKEPARQLAGTTEKGSKTPGSELIEAADAATNTANDLLDVLDVFDTKVPGKLKKTIKTAKMLTGFVKNFDVLTTAIGGFEEVVGLGEIATAFEGSGALFGLTSAAESLSFLGVPGLVIGAGIMAAGWGIGEYDKYNQRIADNDNRRNKNALIQQRNMNGLYYPDMDEHSFIYKQYNKPLKTPVAQKAIEQYSEQADKMQHNVRLFRPPNNLFQDNTKLPPAPGYPLPGNEKKTVASDLALGVDDLRDKLINIRLKKGDAVYHNYVYKLLAEKQANSYDLSVTERQVAVRAANATVLERSKEQYKKQHQANTKSKAGNAVGGTTIHFNKALIEHFTINVRDTKAGMAGFKRKVEEVLLEILNSVTTIH